MLIYLCVCLLNDENTFYLFNIKVHTLLFITCLLAQQYCHRCWEKLILCKCMRPLCKCVSVWFRHLHLIQVLVSMDVLASYAQLLLTCSHSVFPHCPSSPHCLRQRCLIVPAKDYCGCNVSYHTSLTHFIMFLLCWRNENLQPNWPIMDKPG